MYSHSDDYGAPPAAARFASSVSCAYRSPGAPAAPPRLPALIQRFAEAVCSSTRFREISSNYWWFWSCSPVGPGTSCTVFTSGTVDEP